MGSGETPSRTRTPEQQARNLARRRAWRERRAPEKVVQDRDEHNRRVLERKQQFKAECLVYKGGACAHCGLVDTCPDVYDFHHNDPSAKEIQLSSRALVRFTEEVRAELDKCELLCSNCHRREHWRLRQPTAEVIAENVDEPLADRVARMESKLALWAQLNQAAQKG